MAKVVKSDPWEAECDARTLQEHAKLMGDKTRLSAAKKVLKEQSKNIDKALGENKPTKRKSKPSKTYI